MPRYEILDKTIQGVPVSQTAFKRAIGEALLKMDGQAGKVDDLIPALGPEWDNTKGRTLVAKTLINMTGSGALKRHPDQRGVYVVAPAFNRNGVSVYDAIEQSVLDSIRKRGGMARSRDIMEDHELRQFGEELREVKERAARMQYGTETDEDYLSSVHDVRKSTEFAQMTKVLSTSQLIRQDCLKRGWYNLPIDELNRMTLRGEYAAYLIQATYAEFLKPNRAFTERDDFFTRVGAVFQEARRLKGVTLLDMTRRRKVNAALLTLTSIPLIKRDLSRHYSEVTSGHRAELLRQGAEPEVVAAYMEDRRNSREGHQFIVDALMRFEKGGEPLEEGGEPAGVNIHLNAPVALYEALAGELGIDPVMASRGMLMLDFRGAKVAPANNAANYERRLDVQEARERRRDGLDDRGSFHIPEDEESGGDDPGGAANEG